MSQVTYQSRWLGRVPYKEAWDYQNELAAKVASGQIPPTLLLLEHPPTYTFGRRGDASNLLWDEDELRRRKIDVHWVDRGGDITYHGPGQLVGYPILPLGPAKAPPRTYSDSDARHITEPSGSQHIPQADFTSYLRKLETVIIRTLARYGVAAGQVPGMTGVWVQADVASRCKNCPPADRLLPSKLAAIGIKVDARGVTRHGFALNINPDMRNWDGIIGCGLEGYPITSLVELTGAAPAMTEVAAEVNMAFSRVFQVELSDDFQT
jgi:lipoyl(octanoyl) transferase